MKRLGIEPTRANYIWLNWGPAPDNWTPEMEMELPEELQDWSIFKIVGDQAIAKKQG